MDVSSLEVVPSIEGNAGFRIKGPIIQQPLATVEIVCWDSSFVLFLSKDKDLAKKFTSFFSDAKEWSRY
jgi:hypothetical protein